MAGARSVRKSSFPGVGGMLLSRGCSGNGGRGLRRAGRGLMLTLVSYLVARARRVVSARNTKTGMDHLVWGPLRIMWTLM